MNIKSAVIVPGKEEQHFTFAPEKILVIRGGDAVTFIYFLNIFQCTPCSLFFILDIIKTWPKRYVNLQVY